MKPSRQASLPSVRDVHETSTMPVHAPQADQIERRIDSAQRHLSEWTDAAMAGGSGFDPWSAQIEPSQPNIIILLQLPLKFCYFFGEPREAIRCRLCGPSEA